MLYQKDPKYAHLPHSEWLKTPDGERWRQASSQYGNPTARPEDRIRGLMGRRPVSDGKGPPAGKPPKPEPGYGIDPGFGGCHTVCDMHGNQTRRCGQKPDPKCKRKGDDWGPWLPYGDTDFVFRRDGVNVDVRPR